MIKAAIFDMDGLLIDSEPLWHRAHSKAFGKVGFEKVTEKHHLGMLGRRTKEAVEYMHGQQPWDGLSIEEVAGMVDDGVIELIKEEGVLKPGVHQVLSVCKKAGLPIAIASSSTQAVIDAVVDTLEIREHFHHIYSAQFEPYGKPHPGVFLKVAEHFKVAPRECVVFEDSPAGVLAAKSAGMLCVAVPEPLNKKDKFIHTADAVLGSLEEFDASLLEKLV